MLQGFSWFNYNVLHVIEPIDFSNLICTAKIIDAPMVLKMVIILAEARLTDLTILTVEMLHLLGFMLYLIPFFIFTCFKTLRIVNCR